MILDDTPATIALVPLGSVKPREIAAVRRALVRTYSLDVVLEARRALPRETYYPPRHRYRSEHLKAWLGRSYPRYTKVLGIMSADISTTARGRKDWGIAGQADLGGRAAVVSSFRAKERVGDVAVHEIGHTLGLPHCPNSGCVMQDAKGRLKRIGVHFCPTCTRRISDWLRKE